MSGALQSFGGSESEFDEAALQHIADLIAERQPNSMVQRFVLVIETADANDRWLSAAVAPGQKSWDTLGLLDWALTAERSVAQATFLDDDDDEEDDD